MPVEIKTMFFFVMTLCSFIGAKLKGGTTQMTTRLISVLIGNACANFRIDHSNVTERSKLAYQYSIV
jgi:hypothetical protein